MPTFLDRLQHAWNAFTNPESLYSYSYGQSSGSRPDRVRLTRGNERSIISAIYNRISLDVAALTFTHVKVDSNKKYISDVNSGLNDCLNIEANKDQTGRNLIQDICISIMDEGVCAVVPIETSFNPEISSAYDILTLRTGKILEWYPDHVRVRVYDDRDGIRKDLMCRKKDIAIIENPFYAVMNEPSSTMQRLIRKLNLLDTIDEQNGSGKLDLIIQLPYVVKTETRKKQAEQRREEIEMQLKSSQYGIAYTDGTEHITQLNRSVESNLMPQVEYLTSMLYSQLCITSGILDGSASEEIMTNYYTRTVEQFSGAIVAEFNRKFLTKTGRSQGQTIMCFRDPFKLVPVGNLADLADKLTRNEIMSSNELRQKIGLKPSTDPKADELRNKNINAQEGETFASTKGTPPSGVKQEVNE